MATLSSLQDRLQGLGTRLKAENEAGTRERMNTNLTLDFTRDRPGSERRPRPLPIGESRLPERPNTISGGRQKERRKIELPLFFEPRQQPDLPELDAHVKEITRKNGNLIIESKKYKSSIEDMEYISELGNGTSGNVVKMLHKSSKKVIAVKQMRRSGNMEETKRVFFDLEVVLKSHDCPYIVQCLGCFITDSDVWICMELMATCLDKLTKRYKQPIPEPILGKISVATLKALHYLKESHGVIHRDVKPSNILLDERGNIKLCDFGISGRLVDSKAKTRSAGCAAYMAPERIDPPDPTKPDYDIRADVWSLGITLVELATGQFPYKDCRNDFEVLTKVLQDDPPSLPKDGTFSPEFCEFVNDCLIKEYRHRPKYKKLLDYSFIKKYEQKKVDVSTWFGEVCHVMDAKARNSPQRQPLPSHLPAPPCVPPRLSKDRGTEQINSKHQQQQQSAVPARSTTHL
nr:dual specificity mitogen-activated protein kinase kinase 7-like isoform X3 [Procambarus clarkii]